jgi:hypothetical protein
MGPLGKGTAMSIAKTIASYVVMQGRIDSASVVRAFPHLKRSTVMKAIQNASQQRLIWVESKGLYRPGKENTPAILCAPKPEQMKARPLANVRVRVASVFDLADPQPLPLPVLPSRKYTPLGPWSELEGAAAA